MSKFPSDLEQFLNDAGLTEFEETFKNEELSLDNILELNHDNLKEIGITKLGQRMRILKGIETFKAKSDKVDSVATKLEKANITGTESNDGRWETAATLTLTSEGPAAEYRGGRLGVFDLLPELTNQAPAYKQRHTVAGEGNYIYKAGNGNWYVSSVLGQNGGGLRNQSASNQVPTYGWQCWNDKTWQPTFLSISTSPPSLCSTITIEAEDKVAKRYPASLGTFTATQDWSAGRQVFRNTNSGELLCVKPGTVNWRVRPTPESVASIQSGCAPSLCPADKRAARSERRGQTSWAYFDNVLKYGGILVKCDQSASNQVPTDGWQCPNVVFQCGGLANTWQPTSLSNAKKKTGKKLPETPRAAASGTSSAQTFTRMARTMNKRDNEFNQSSEDDEEWRNDDEDDEDDQFLADVPSTPLSPPLERYSPPHYRYSPPHFEEAPRCASPVYEARYSPTQQDSEM